MYTYLIGWSKHDRWYYGSRVANKVPPEQDLWIKYKSSSTYVKKFVAEHGDPDVIRVHKRFASSQDAQLFEQKMLRRMNVIHSPRWLNQNISGRPLGGTPVQLAAVRKPKSEEWKAKMRLRVVSDETRKKLSAACSGEKNGMSGKKGELHPLYGTRFSEERKLACKLRSLEVHARKRLSPEGDKRKPCSEETKMKISIAQKARLSKKPPIDRTSLFTDPGYIEKMRASQQARRKREREQRDALRSS